MIKQHKFTIEGKLPNLNDIIAEAKKGRGSYQPYAEMKREYTDLVDWCAKGMPKFKSEVEIEITWFEPNKRRDVDGISAGGCKFILDGLVQAGVIINDNQKYVKRINNNYEVDKENPRIEVEIREVKL